MIYYKADKWGIFFAFKLHGSVFPKSCMVAGACAVLTVVLHQIFEALDWKEDIQVGEKGTSVLGMFTFVLGFLLVFRTQQAYSRWWEGGTLLQELRGEWFNAYSCLLAFGNSAPEKQLAVQKFNHELARLMSMLYGAGLAQVCSLERKEFEVLDLEDFDIESLIFVDDAHDACEVVLQWVQQLIGAANDTATIKVAPPILSRVYNQLGNGIVKLNNARKITNFPIPFPFAQMITAMLIVHFLAATIICSTSIDSPVWAGMLSFAVILSFWSINFIALELEDPFGDDPNDLPMQDMQNDMNLSLKELLCPECLKAPKFDFNPAYHSLAIRQKVDFCDLHDCVKEILNRRPDNAFQIAESGKTDWLPEKERMWQEKLRKIQETTSSIRRTLKHSKSAEGLVPAAITIPAPALAKAAPVAAPAPAPAAKAAAPPPSSTAVVTSLLDADDPRHHERNLLKAEKMRLNARMEGHLSRAAGELTKAVAELQNIADRQTVLYQLHCDFWGLLSTMFAKPLTSPRSPLRSTYKAPIVTEMAFEPQTIVPEAQQNGRDDERSNLLGQI